jgi:thiamine biosynthesis lipoprotein ApbE
MTRSSGAVVDEVARLERIFSVFDATSAPHQCRRTGTTDVVELGAVIDLATHWPTRTGGAFHPGVQPRQQRGQDACTGGSAHRVSP